MVMAMKMKSGTLEAEEEVHERVMREMKRKKKKRKRRGIWGVGASSSCSWDQKLESEEQLVIAVAVGGN